MFHPPCISRGCNGRYHLGKIQREGSRVIDVYITDLLYKLPGEVLNCCPSP